MSHPHHSNARQVALKCLVRWHSSNAFAETLIEQESRNNHLSESDRKLCQAMVYGVIRNMNLLDAFITRLRDGQIDLNTRLILQLGLAQIFILNLSSHAAVFETVNLAPKKTTGLINAILRGALRQKDHLLYLQNTLPLFQRFSTPIWLINRWTQAFGEEACKQLLEWNNTTPRLFARKTQGANIDAEALQLEPLKDLPDWYQIKGKLPLEALKQGDLYISDPSTRHAIDLLAPKEGESILDACAAPGGKSAAILSQTHGNVKLLATDLHDYRLPTLVENLSQHSKNPIETAQADWTRPCPDAWKNAFDAVLLDVPCSNTGVIQRRVDVRWRLDQQEITRLAQLQSAILRNAAQAVKPGGRLVYSTCSIDAVEDQQVVQQFLANHPDWSFVEEKLALPHLEHADGAYAALLVKASV